MAKDPAFLFYSSDFMTGITLLNFEQRGKYITLLCLQHQSGHLSEQDMLMICGTYDKRIFDKFIKDADGHYFNDRLEIEINKRKAYSESRKNNRLGSAEKHLKPKPRKAKKTSKSYVEHMENENEIEDVNKDKLVYPFESEIFKTAWHEWKDYKKTEHKFTYKTLKTEQAALKEIGELSNYNISVAIKIIQKSIASGYKGLFELKNTNNGKQGTSTVQSGLDKIDAMYSLNQSGKFGADTAE